MAGTEQAYLSIGTDPQTAQLAAMAGLTRPTLGPLREVSRHLDGLKDEFIKADDFDAAHPTVLVGLDLGQKIQSQAPYLVDQLVGMSIERAFLEQLDPLTATGANGQTAADRLAELDAKKAEQNRQSNEIQRAQGDERTRLIEQMQHPVRDREESTPQTQFA